MTPSRQMLPAEIVVSLFALSYACVGGLAWPVQPGPLYRLIYAHEGVAGNLTLFLFMGLPALGLIITSIREMLFSKRCRWSIIQHDTSARFRSRLVICQFFSWCYMFHVLLLTHRTLAIVAIHSVIGIIVCAWSYWENRRVRREIRYSTTSFVANS